MKLVKDMSKEEVISLVDSEEAGALVFTHWYKNTLHYQNNLYTVTIVPDYRDECGKEETLNHLLCCEDYNFVNVFEGLEKPFNSEWYKTGDNL